MPGWESRRSCDWAPVPPRPAPPSTPCVEGRHIEDDRDVLKRRARRPQPDHPQARIGPPEV